MFYLQKIKKAAPKNSDLKINKVSEPWGFKAGGALRDELRIAFKLFRNSQSSQGISQHRTSASILFSGGKKSLLHK